MPTKKAKRSTKNLRKAKSLKQVKPLTTGRVSFEPISVPKRIDHSNP